MACIRAGKLALSVIFCASDSDIHAPISEPVRPQPTQKPVTASITQIFTHGLAEGIGLAERTGLAEVTELILQHQDFFVFSHFNNLEHINKFLSSEKIEKKFAFSKKVKRKQKLNFAFSKIFLRKQNFFSFFHIKTS